MEMEPNYIIAGLATMKSAQIYNLPQKARYHGRYLLNDAYNKLWVFKTGIQANDPMHVADMQTHAPSKEHAQPFMTVWLKNIDRLLAPIKGHAYEYDFVDVGCGRGVSTLYVSHEYDFRTVSGFDFESALIDDALRNEVAMASFTHIDFFIADASKHKLDHRKQIVFMFNPFGAPVMEDFMRNNIDTLRATGSKIAYANYHQLDTILKFAPVHVHDIQDYRCALISF